NNKGLVVKDKYLRLKALRIADTLKISDFSCSSGYIEIFKKRHGFVSRVHTTSRMLPENAKELAIGFINSTRKLIEDYDIKLKKIINFDQVPRYFEQENIRTLTLKETKNIMLLKTNNTHSRFTYTPIISASGKFIACHCLFSNLKKTERFK
ncbi:Major centromere autoantigen B, partial [Dictyocoela muelleri]